MIIATKKDVESLMLKDMQAKQQFVLSKPALRRFSEPVSPIALAPNPFQEKKEARLRGSCREFDKTVISFPDFSR